jgi:cargo-transport protein YPP1
MWMAYYETLSQILRLDFIYSPVYTDSKPQIMSSGEGLSDDEYISARLKQRTELKSVEARIESRLLDETSFPKAGVRNDRVERWVDAIMENWRILCGSNWHDEGLGQGGKNAIARGVLDILHRAATKTFHSTQILRHLFTVHAYLAEFDLAMKALETYLDLVTRARARSEKSGEPDYSLDDNDMVLTTMADAICILCQFGQRTEAEKALHVAGKLKLWLGESEMQPEISEAPLNVNGHTVSPVDKSTTPSTVARAYHALGVSEAQWARLTYEASTRTQHQNQAQEHFRQALHRKYRNSKNLTYLYSLAILLAEMRDIAGALKTTKTALAEASSHTGDEDTFTTERKLVQFWHLLTLLLSSRMDYLNAAKASNAAFEQFQDMGILFGQQEYRSEHLNESEKPHLHSPALIDSMGTLEKVGILQVKMTQVALLEALEGPTQAVDASLDLLALYVRLFGQLPGQTSHKLTRVTQKPPKSRIGSIKASIFKRAVSRRGNNRVPLEVPKPLTRPATAATATTVATSTTAPTIQVTDLSSSTELRGRTINGTQSPASKVDSINKSIDGEKEVHRSRSRSKMHIRDNIKRSIHSPHPPSSAGVSNDEMTKAALVHDSNANDQSNRDSVSAARPSTAGSVASRGTFSTIRTSRHRKRDSRFSMQTIESDGGMEGAASRINPTPMVPDLVDRRYRTSMLVELWLFIAGMYCRAEIYEEAKDAIEEAEQLVDGLESETSRINSSAKAFACAGWGGGKSVDEMRGDIMTQVGVCPIIYASAQTLTTFQRGDLGVAQLAPHKAMSFYEKALDYWPSHADGIVGLSNLLIDVYEEKIPRDLPHSSALFSAQQPSSKQEQVPQQVAAAKPAAVKSAVSSSASSALAAGSRPSDALGRNATGRSVYFDAVSVESRSHKGDAGDDAETEEAEASESKVEAKSNGANREDPTPEMLDRLAARDRAYFLLSTLSKLGNGWACSEAWNALSRVYEAAGQMEKAKNVLYWVVELEDSRPLRPWEAVGFYN